MCNPLKIKTIIIIIIKTWLCYIKICVIVRGVIIRLNNSTDSLKSADNKNLMHHLVIWQHQTYVYVVSSRKEIDQSEKKCAKS